MLLLQFVFFLSLHLTIGRCSFYINTTTILKLHKHDKHNQNKILVFTTNIICDIFTADYINMEFDKYNELFSWSHSWNKFKNFSLLFPIILHSCFSRANSHVHRYLHLPFFWYLSSSIQHTNKTSIRSLALHSMSEFWPMAKISNQNFIL